MGFVRPCEVIMDVAVVPLTKGRVSVIDSWLVDEVSRYSWHCVNRYAGRSPDWRKTSVVLYLHRHVLALSGVEIPPKMVVDHINRDPLDNRISNLRVVTQRENSRNQVLYPGRRFRGVYRSNPPGKWVVRLQDENRVFRSYGRYKTEIEAAIAYNEFVIKRGGVYVLNEIPNDQ